MRFKIVTLACLALFVVTSPVMAKDKKQSKQMDQQAMMEAYMKESYMSCGLTKHRGRRLAGWLLSGNGMTSGFLVSIILLRPGPHPRPLARGPRLRRCSACPEQGRRAPPREERASGPPLLTSNWVIRDKSAFIHPAASEQQPAGGRASEASAWGWGPTRAAGGGARAAIK